MGVRHPGGGDLRSDRQGASTGGACCGSRGAAGVRALRHLTPGRRWQHLLYRHTQRCDHRAHGSRRFGALPGTGCWRPVCAVQQARAAAVNTRNRSFAIKAEVEIPAGGTQWVIFAHGSRFGGQVLDRRRGLKRREERWRAGHGGLSRRLTLAVHGHDLANGSGYQ